MNAYPWPAGRRCAVSISFDDGNASQPRRAGPVLDAHGVVASFYVNMSRVLPHTEAWRRMAQQGHEIGNHTTHHPCSGKFSWSRQHALEDYDLARMEAEILQANQEITSCFGRTPTSFAYCCGQTYVGRGAATRSYVPLVAKHFTMGRTYRTEHPNDPAFVDLAQVGAQGIDGVPGATMAQWVDAAVASGEWLVLAGHDVIDTPGHGVQVRDLEILLRHLRTRPECWVDTCGAIGAYIAAQRATAVP